MAPFTCHSCGCTTLHQVLNLGRSPFSNDIKAPHQIPEPLKTYPLQLIVCDECRLLQLPAYAKREEIFNDQYAYFSSYSKTMLKHVEDFSVYMRERFHLTEESLVVEVASNDGYMLQFFKPYTKVIGIEPCDNVAAVAIEKGITTCRRFFGLKISQHVSVQFGRADLIVGFNVLAHVPDLNDFVGGVKNLLAPGGVAVFEFPHVFSLLKGQIDTVYHEHFSYLSILALQPLFIRHNLEIFDVESTNIHGGSIRIYVGHRGHCLPTDGLKQMQALEKSHALEKLTTYNDLAWKALRIKCELLNFLCEAARFRELVVGYGSPAKATTLLNYCGIGPELLRFTTDVMPSKIDHYIPGVDIPIVHEKMLPASNAAHILILPWNLQEEIVPKIHALYREAEKLPPRLWVAIPELRQITT